MANKLANKKKSSKALKAKEKVVRHEAAVADQTPKVLPNGVVKQSAKADKNGHVNGAQNGKSAAKEIQVTASVKAPKPSVDVKVERKQASSSAASDPKSQAPRPGAGTAPLPFSKEEILNDYRIAHQSRLASVLGRKEVLTGKAKFGIFGDGKEIPQLAMAKAFKKGDWRSGYYRDQTFMFATGMSNVQEFFAQLYAHVSVEAEPASAGRMMNGHFASRSLNPDGSWKNLMEQPNSSADISPTGGQMPRLLGLAYASKLYRELPDLKSMTNFSRNGDEVAFGTIGNASTSEGLFCETFNAAGVLQVPMVISVWDDGYGISVPAKYQTTKEHISDILRGFELDERGGYRIYTLKGWDYAELCKTYLEGVELVRKEHVPALFHITELTQPQGHSTSGSHERYKTKERLQWEEENDGIKKMRQWMIDQGVATAEQMDAIDRENKEIVDAAQKRAWEAYLTPIKKEISEAVALFDKIAATSPNAEAINAQKNELLGIREPLRRDTHAAVNKVIRLARNAQTAKELIDWRHARLSESWDAYNSLLYSESPESALNVKEIKPVFNGDSPKVDGRQVLQACFDQALTRDARVFAIGEDIGSIGDVNKAFEDMQAKHGHWRVTDTGIREATIIGQAIGAAMRGLRPIAEIQYLDYLLFALQTMSDDLATVQYRTKGGQKAPVIVRTRGHRLEGVWHSGSPMGMILHSLRGMYVLVPRNMTQAAGFYNTMLKSDDTALIVEVLNGYRLKETLPANIGEFTLPLGIPETLREGTDVTLVTYGACCRVAIDAADELAKHGINIEIIDVQSLLPFDINHQILESIKKTGRVAFLDEDVQGGATGFMMQQVMEVQGAFKYLDSAPITITSMDHRPAYGSDGDYFSKSTPDDVFERIYDMMHEADPQKYPVFYR
jgi:pyruvate/2-oxoglutarate/acetoin dehydrogenase E1 component/TPP-dependent pyruvate/acetoin dehydrogenase alpha subunit